MACAEDEIDSTKQLIARPLVISVTVNAGVASFGVPGEQGPISEQELERRVPVLLKNWGENRLVLFDPLGDVDQQVLDRVMERFRGTGFRFVGQRAAFTPENDTRNSWVPNTG